jgi:hypothetical protein
MALNKSGEMKLGQVIVWVIIIGVVAYIANFGGFKGTVDNLLSGVGNDNNNNNNEPVLTDTAECPTDGTTTFTINIQDALATTASSKYPEYYVFNGNQLIKEGTLSSSANTVSLTCGKDYQALLINTTAGDGNGLYPKVVDLKARVAQQTVNDKMYLTGDAKIFKIINVQEGESSTYYNNMSLGKSTTKNFRIMFNANTTARAYNQPIILCQVNVTEIQTLSLTSFSDGKTPVAVQSLPKRITARTGNQYYGWEYPGMLDPTQPVVYADGSITSTSTGPVAAASSNMSCLLVDQQMWKTSQYKTATSIAEGFKTGPENTENLADVGAPDSAKALLVFVNDEGL